MYKLETHFWYYQKGALVFSLIAVKKLSCQSLLTLRGQEDHNILKIDYIKSEGDQYWKNNLFNLLHDY